MIGDPLLLRQVLTYLIYNAVKYTRARDPAVIDIGSRRGRADEQVIWVRDNGMGFDMQQASSLFAAFLNLPLAVRSRAPGKVSRTRTVLSVATTAASGPRRNWVEAPHFS